VSGLHKASDHCISLDRPYCAACLGSDPAATHGWGSSTTACTSSVLAGACGQLCGLASNPIQTDASLMLHEHPRSGCSTFSSPVAFYARIDPPCMTRR